MQKVARNMLTEATRNAERTLSHLERIYKYGRVEKNDTDMAHMINDLKSILNAQLKTMDAIQERIKTGSSKPLYPGDDVTITIDPPKENPITCYDRKVFIISLWNTGTITWKNRTIEFVQTQKPHPVVTTSPQPIQTLNPGETARIPVVIDASGNKGEFLLKCEIRDAHGDDCFPNRPDVIEIPVTVKSKS